MDVECGVHAWRSALRTMRRLQTWERAELSDE